MCAQCMPEVEPRCGVSWTFPIWGGLPEGLGCHPVNVCFPPHRHPRMMMEIEVGAVPVEYIICR